MSGYDNTNSGALFKNDRKTTDNHPDYKGSLDVNGVQFWVSSWIKTKTSDGTKFMSLKLTAKDQQQSPPSGGGAKPGKTPGADLDDDIPFICQRD